MSTKPKLATLLRELHTNDSNLIIKLLKLTEHTEVFVPIVERLIELRATIETLEDNDLVNDIAKGLKEIEEGKVAMFEDL